MGWIRSICASRFFRGLGFVLFGQPAPTATPRNAFVKTARLITCLLAAMLASASLWAQPTSPTANDVAAAAPLPAWLSQRIAEFEADPERADALEVWALTYQGRPAYYFFSNCCDRYNPLHDATGQVICAPNGGIVNQGDGRCPGALHASPERTRIWVARPRVR